jgi:hypothetical protein
MDNGNPFFLRTVFLIAGAAAGLAGAAAPVSAPTLAADSKANGEAVILLHGLARSKYSMYRIERSLRQTGYAVYCVVLPSRPIESEHIDKRELNANLTEAQGGDRPFVDIS